MLLGAEHSYFTGKTKAYLRYKGIPHSLVPASQELFSQIILPKGLVSLPGVWSNPVCSWMACCASSSGIKPARATA